MGLFSKKTEFKAIQDFDKNKPIRDLFDMYINSVDDSWEIYLDNWRCDFSKQNDSAKVEVCVQYSTSNGIITFSEEPSLSIVTQPNNNSDRISFKYAIPDKLKERIYKAYVDKRTKENSKIENEVMSQINKFKSPFAKEILRDNKINDILG
jgi:hypothetical protein